MPGAHITDRQVARYMTARTAGSTQFQSADRAAISERTARRLDRQGRQARGPREYRTRADDFSEVWIAEVEPMLRRDSKLQASTLFDELQRCHPGRFPDGKRRTLERRIRSWRALHGTTAQATMFPQEHPPGWQGLLDFTVCNELSVTIGGESLPHRLGHFVLGCSGWEYAHVILGGESYPALAETLRLSLESLGGVPKTLRTDSLSAAYTNLKQQQEMTAKFEALCRHYGCTPTRNSLGVAHENGSVESPNGHLKNRLDQALRLRGSRDFPQLEDYRAFVHQVVAAANLARAVALAQERSALLPLPRFPGVTWSEEVGVVSSFSIIRVRKVSYMVPGRLMRHRLTIRLYDDRLEFFDLRQLVFACPRSHTGRRVVDYRLIIDALVRKPGAFARLIYRDDLHPRPVFARTWMELRERLSEHAACTLYLRLLHLAHAHVCEEALALRLEECLAAGSLPDLERLRAELAAPRLVSIPFILVPPPDPAAYDRLLTRVS